MIQGNGNYTWKKVKREVEKECRNIYETTDYTVLLTYLIASIVFITDKYFYLFKDVNWEMNNN